MMAIRTYFKALPVVAAMLLTIACSSSDSEIENAPQPAQARIIPFTATVSSDSQTRASLLPSKDYCFQNSDKLFVWGDNIKGELTAVSFEHNETEATFSGNLIWTGEGNPASDLKLNAVIKGPNDEILPATVDEFIAGGCQPTYTKSIAANEAEAVEKYSHLVASTTFGKKLFIFRASTGAQHSAFVLFSIFLEDGTPKDTEVKVSIKENGSEVRKGTVRTTVNTIEKKDFIVAKFIAGFPATSVSNLTVILDSRDAIKFGTKLLSSNTIYRVSNLKYKITVDNFTTSTKYTGANTTLGDILGDVFKSINSFEKVENSGDNITFGSFDASNWKATTVEITGPDVGGNPAKIKVSGTLAKSNATATDLELPIYVSKMQY